LSCPKWGIPWGIWRGEDHTKRWSYVSLTWEKGKAIKEDGIVDDD